MEDIHYIIFFISFSILLIALIYFIYNNSNLKANCHYLEDTLKRSESTINDLNHESIMLKCKVQEYITKLEAKESIIKEFEHLRVESQNATKAALFDLGNDLSKKLIELHKSENKEVRNFSEQKIEESAKKFNSEFERIVSMVGSLSKEIEQSRGAVDLIKTSLLSPSGGGRLAEITLENLFKNSGLRSKTDYVLQYSAMGEDNNKLRPDAIVYLPGNNIMIVDAKTSKFLIEDETKGSLARSMNSHLKSLNSKDYAGAVSKKISKNNNIRYNIITLMFLPTEQSLEMVIEADPDFMNKAWSANVFPVGPTGVMNMLSFAKFQINEQLMIENHNMIIEEVRKLIGGISNLTEYSNRLGNSLQSAISNYDKFAGSFNRNFLSRANKINNLGLDENTSKISSPLTRYQIVSTHSDHDELSINDPELLPAKEDKKLTKA